MGAFLVNFHAKSDDAAALRDLLGEMAERAWLAPPQNGWMSFYEERADIQDSGRIMELAEAASDRLACPLIAFLVHDSDFLCYWLYERGALRDQFNSCPDYFGELDEDDGEQSPPSAEAMAGDAAELIRLCNPQATRQQIDPLLSQSIESMQQFIFAEQRLARLSQLLGIDPERATRSYRDIGLEIDASESGLEFVGAGEPPAPGEDSWARAFDGDGGLQLFSSDDPQMRLHQAAVSADLAAAQRAFQEGADVQSSVGGYTPLLAAITGGSVELVELMIDQGANVSGGDMHGATPLQYAVRVGSPDLVRLLLQRGADVSRANAQGWTALHDAAGAQKPEIVKDLLDAGANPLSKNDLGQTPRHYAEASLANFEAALATIKGNEPAVQRVREIMARIQENVHMLSAAEDRA